MADTMNLITTECKKTDFTCPDCSISFVSESSKRRHMRNMTCIRKTQDMSIELAIDNAKQKIFDIHGQEVDRLNNLIQRLLEKMQLYERDAEVIKARMYKLEVRYVTNNTVTNSINNNNVHQPTVLRSYGKEDTLQISQEELIELAQDPHSAVIQYIKRKHFDSCRPENRNLRLNSIKRKEVGVYKDGTWEPLNAHQFTSDALATTLEYMKLFIVWETIKPEAEKYFHEVLKNPNCSQGKVTQHGIMNLLQKERERSQSIKVSK